MTWARLPLAVFMPIYLVTCLFGAIVMLAGVHNFNQLYLYFSGTPVAHLSFAQGSMVVVLLVAAPVLLWVGYEVGLRVALPAATVARVPQTRSRLADGRLRAPVWFPFVVFSGVALIAIVSIVRAGSLHDLSSWLHYNSWIAARERAFAGMRFFQFVDIYLLVPVAASWIVISYRTPGLRALVLRWLPVLVMFGIDVLLFQKKTAIVSLLIVLFAWVLAVGPLHRRRVAFGAVAALVVATLVYMATVVVPVWSEAATASICNLKGVTCHGHAGVPSVVAYALLSPLTRSSAPALYYPIVFPHHHAYYSFSSLFALDVLGIGVFPNDNQVVWHFLNPHLPGTTMVPYQFTLYSQGGIAVALVGSVVVGMILSLSWRFVRSEILPATWSALVGSMVLLLALYVALDNLRNSTLVSYGMVWGVLFIAVMLAAVRFGNRTLAVPARGLLRRAPIASKAAPPDVTASR